MNPRSPGPLSFAALHKQAVARAQRSAVAVCFAIAGLLPLVTQAAEDVIQVANWNDYVDEQVLADFTAETGIRVEYMTYETDEEGMRMLGRSGLDVIAPPSTHLREIVARKQLVPFVTPASNWKGVHRLVMQRTLLGDPSARHVVPYMWGRIGVIVDVDKVAERLGEAPPASWGLVFNPSVVKKLADCGVSVLDSPNDVLNLVSMFKGHTMDSISRREMQAFMGGFAALAPLYRAIDSAAYLEDMPKGELCVAMVWEGDGRMLQRKHKNLKFILPEEGTVLFMDNMAIPAKADNLEGAKKYIEFMSRPEISTRNAEHTGYNSPSAAVLSAVGRKHPDFFVDMASVASFLPLTPERELYRELSAFWVGVLAAPPSPKADAPRLAEARVSGSKL